MRNPFPTDWKDAFGRAFFFLAAAPFFLLTSCFDSEEEFWLNADASGAARIRVSLPAAAASLYGGRAGAKDLVETFLNDTPAFRSHRVTTRVEKGQLEIEASVTFDNALDLAELADGGATGKIPAAASGLIGKTDIQFQGLNLVFARRIDLGKTIPGAVFIPQSSLAGHVIKTTVHLPKAATSHNATSSGEGGRVLRWITPVHAALGAPLETRFTMPLPIPWITVCVVLFALALLSAISLRTIRQRKKGRQA